MKIGIIGGSGLYDMKDISNVERRKITTPFGEPSDEFVCGRLGNSEVVFLPRHGRGHRILPSEINYRANICGMKMLGVERVISISAVGSLKENLRPGDMVLPDQYFDRTKSSAGHTFFGQGIVGHVQFGSPTCDELRSLVALVIKGHLAGAGSGARLQDRGVYVNMEGPAFSTRAEAEMHRKLGFDVIGMTSLAEAKLCREAELCYQPVSFITDYDCWHTSAEEVSVETVMAVLSANVRLAQELVCKIAAAMPALRTCKCDRSLENAIVTDRKMIPPETLKRLEPIAGRRLGIR